MSDKNAVFSSLWKNLRCRRGLFFACAGILFFFLGGKALLNDPTDQFALWTIYVGCMFFVPGAALALVTWRREIMALGLTSAATAIRGHVLSVKKDWLSQGYVLRYNFNDPMGRTYRGERILSQQEAFTWREREEGEVRYDSNAPGISVWIGRAVEFDAEDGSATAPATIIEVTERHDEGDKQTLVRYRYRDHLGESHEDQFIEDKGAQHKIGEAGKVEFDLRHPGLSAWLGTTEALPGSDGITAAIFPAQRKATPMLAPTSRPSTFQLAKRSKSLKNAILLLFYIFIAAFFSLLMVVAVGEPSSPDDVLGLSIFFVILVALVVWFMRSLWKGMRQVKDWQRILNQDSAAEATVTLVEEKRQRLGRWTWKPGWVIGYRYSDHEGKSHTGESGYLSRREASQWRSRDGCVVMYDPAQPSTSVWVGKP